MRYYFDLRDGDEIITDDEGLELNGIDRVQEEAAWPTWQRMRLGAIARTGRSMPRRLRR
jgi:hypothetical protein